MADARSRTRKFIKVGNSYALTVDKAIVDRYFEGGSLPVTLNFDDKKEELIFRKEKRVLSKAQKSAILRSKVTPEYQAWVEKSLEEDAESMRELANL